MKFTIRLGRAKLSGLFLLLLVGSFLVAPRTQAQTWLSSPGTTDWNTGSNWDTSTAPNSSSASATFDASGTTSVTMTAPVSVGTLQFNAAAPAYTINVNSTSFSLLGAGIINNSSASQSINNNSGSNLNFYNNASAGNAWLYSGYSSYINFYNNSTAGNSWIDSNNSDQVSFNDNSTAGNAIITNHTGNGIYFGGMSSAGNASINNQGQFDIVGSSSVTLATLGNANITNTGAIYFDGNSTAGAATITTNSGGYVRFQGSNSTGGTAQFIFNGTGYLDMSYTGNSFPLTIGSLAGSGSVSLGAYDLAIGSNNLNTSFTGILSDGGAYGGTGGSLTKVGSGILTLSGTNVYTGSTTVAGGILGLGNNSALSTGEVVMQSGTILQAESANLSIGNGVSLIDTSGILDAHGQALTMTGVIGGIGALNVINSTGSGVVYLTGSNTYSGGTGVNNNGILNIQNDGNIGNNGLSLNGGTLQAGAGGLSLSENVTVGSFGGTFDTHGTISTLSGVISGNYGLAVTNSTGSGVVTLLGIDTYTGGTSILGGATLAVTAQSALGTGSVYNLMSTLDYLGNADAGNTTILNQGAVGAPYTYSHLNFLNNASAGSATINNHDRGEVDFRNNATAANSKIYSGYYSYIYFYDNSTAANGWFDSDNSDAIYFYNNSTAASATITNSGNSVLYFQNTASAGNALIDNQTGSVVQFYGAGAGTTATAGNANITNTGTVQFQNYSTAAASTITTNSGGSVWFYNLTDGGTADLAFNGTGYLEISNASSPLTIGSLAGSGFVSLGSKNLVDGSNNLNTIFSGVLADGGSAGGTGGSLTKIGTGTLVLSGANVYTGGTDVEAGTLLAGNANAFGPGNMTVNGGTLGLSGPMTVNIGGNYTQGAGGTLKIGIGPSATQWDRLHITGTATLAGTLSLVPYSGFQFHDNASMIILDATSVTGTFGTVTSTVNFGAVSVVYNPTDVVLDVTANAPTFASLGTTYNQTNIGTVLDGLATTSPGSALVTYLDSQANLALPGIYDQLSPANLTPLYQMGFAAAQVEAGMVGQRFSQMFGDSGFASSDVSWNGGTMFAANVPASEEAETAKKLEPQHWGVFANGMGKFGTVTGDSNATGYQYSIGGMVVGMDYRFSKSFAAGLLLGYSSSGTSQSTGTVSGTGGQAGLYAGWSEDSIHIEGLAEGGVNNYTTQRTVLGVTASGSPQGQELSGQLSAGYDFKVDQMKVGPFVSCQYTSVDISSFKETGSIAPLSFVAQSEANLSSDLGATASRSWDLGGLTLSPSLSAAWEHVYQGNLDSLTANFATGNNFTVSGPSTGTDAAVLGAGVNARLDKGVNAFVQYQGKVGLTNYVSQNFSGGVNFGF